jgi:arsenite/tail-anchored protein-transporting ATPase
VRVLLLVGAGGAGTTTVAAATAVTAARGGVKTLLLSTDRRSSMTDVLGLEPLPAGRAHVDHHEVDREVLTEVEPGLAVLQSDLATLQSYARHLPGALPVADVPALDLLTLPGAREVVALSSLTAQVQDGPWDLVVVDVAGGSEALAAPENMLRLLNRTWSRHLGGLRRHGAERGVAGAVATLRDELAAVRDVLRAPTTSVRLVLAPEQLGLAHARRQFTALTMHGYVVDRLIANKVVPAGGGPSWLASRAAVQARVLAEADGVFAPLPIRRLPHLPVEPVGPGALAQLGTGVEQLLAVPSPGVGPQVRRTPDGYELVLLAPFVTAADVELSREGDELRLGVQGTWRVEPLPPVLRRCIATGARVDAGSLVVQFRPDPELWPINGGWQ